MGPMTSVTHSTATDGAAQVAASDRSSWHSKWTARLAVTDLVVLLLATAIAMAVRFGVDAAPTTNGPVEASYASLGVAIAIGWYIALFAMRSRDRHILGGGAEEYRRVARASFTTFGLLAIVALMIKLDMSRGYLAVAFPVGLAGLLFSRWVWRQQLRRLRRRGRMTTGILVIGGAHSAQTMADWFEANPTEGFRVQGVWTPDQQAVRDCVEVGGVAVPTFDASASLTDALVGSEAQLVVVSDSEHLGHNGLKELIWELDANEVDLMVSPNVMDVTDSRLDLIDVASMPLLAVREPTYESASQWQKTTFDRIVGAVVLVLATPLMLGVALAIKLTSPGPVFYQQTRIGKDSEPFGMIKFRSMRQGADAELQDLIEGSGGTLAELPKVTNDPRITKVGGLIRRYSIDELPQLFNVLKGEMSLVGPRPQRDFEVAAYDKMAFRRLRVRPGMTGLWQVSGRSDLSFEDAIRLDIQYVENWSLLGDLLIMARTIKAVVTAGGAY